MWSLESVEVHVLLKTCRYSPKLSFLTKKNQIGPGEIATTNKPQSWWKQSGVHSYKYLPPAQNVDNHLKAGTLFLRMQHNNFQEIGNNCKRCWRGNVRLHSQKYWFSLLYGYLHIMPCPELRVIRKTYVVWWKLMAILPRRVVHIQIPNLY